MKWLVTLVLLCSFASSALAAPTVSLSPATAGIAPATQIDVRVFANAEVPPLGCFSFSVDFNPAVLTLTGASEGALFTNSAEPTFFGTGIDALGRTEISGCLLGFETVVVPPGELAVLHFDVIAEGTTTIDLVEGILRDIDRASIASVVFEGATIIVGATGVGLIGEPGRILAWPNPSSSAVRLSLSGETGDHDRMEIYDAAGRRIRSLPWSGASTSTLWDGRDALGQPVAAGLYFAVLHGGSTPPLRAKLLRLR